MATKLKRKASGVEWVGGIVTMPLEIAEEGAPYRPEMLVWMTTDAKVLGHLEGKPGEVLSEAADSFGETCKRPLVGRPHSPVRVRVNSSALAEALRVGHPEQEVVCAPTPEIDALVSAMGQAAQGETGKDASYLSPPKIDEKRVGAFFGAAAALFRSAPWEIETEDGLLFADVEEMGIRDSVVSIVGGRGEAFGLLFFPSVDELDAFSEAARDLAEGREPRLPGHLVLNFSVAAELPSGLRQEILRHQWEVADKAAYPWISSVSKAGVDKPSTADEITFVEIVARGVSELARERELLSAAWNGGASLNRTFTVESHRGPVEITLRAPIAGPPREPRPMPEILEDLRSLHDDGDGEIDEDARHELEDELLTRLGRSPEAEHLPDLHWSEVVLDYGARHLGATLPTLTAADLEEILFDIFPEKVTMEASAAGAVIEEIRALYRLVQREANLEQVEECLRLVGEGAEQRLEEELSDTSRFGMAKSMLMSGLNAGFDMQSKEGIEAWARQLSSGPLPGSMRSGGQGGGRTSGPGSKAAAQAKKDQRKAAKKARKKNR